MTKHLRVWGTGPVYGLMKDDLGFNHFIDPGMSGCGQQIKDNLPWGPIRPIDL